MIDYLFVCSANLQRSPTAEHVARMMGYRALSAGSVPYYNPVQRLTPELIAGAEHIVCMEAHHAEAVHALSPPHVIALIEVWDIPDDFQYCDPQLITLFTELIKRNDYPKPR